MSSNINVLLSTYNGANFLSQQLDSILSQSYKNIIINIRDDGSKDNTPEILRHFASDQTNINVEYGNNVGVINSFFNLLRDADERCAYFAFSDQDDIWQSEKLKNAISMLEAYDSRQPLLYCSNIEYVDSSLNHIGFSRIPLRIGFGNALVENIVTGCSIVMNRKARDLILERIPSGALMHDWWFYLVVSAFGIVVYDNKSQIKYRQHGGNLVGGTPDVMKQLINRIFRFLRRKKNSYRVYDQAKEFSRCYGDFLDEINATILKNFLESKRNFPSRINYVLRMNVWRQSVIDTLLLQILIISGCY